MLTTADWDSRYRLQAGWTRDLRRYAYRQVGLHGAGRVLEVGCGTGAVLADFTGYAKTGVFGVDINLESLHYARKQLPSARLAAANALRLPFANAVFDAALCHFFLLWVDRPAAALAEMARVTRPGGAVLALAEPDYGGRIDYPPPLEPLGRLQTDSLRRQGAEPLMGRRLAGLMRGAGLVQVQTGVLQAGWGGAPPKEARASEWQVLRSDLGDSVPAADLAAYERIDREAWQFGERVLYVPTFYAWGRVP
ncbi:MAG TPA: class I SAM-dependent methyltransferase [Anaerolineaceae bacterium]|nr:class I SAM-dependent methyltransferase [Anaerolineaceae bacterium]